MNLKNKEKVMLVMIPYLRPDFPPLALAMMKGILDQYGVDTKSRDFNTDVHEYFKNNEIVELEKFCSDGTYRTNTIVKKYHLTGEQFNYHMELLQFIAKHGWEYAKNAIKKYDMDFTVE